MNVMSDNLVQAGGGAEAFIWIILAVFWVIAQLISKAARRLPPTRPQSAPRPQPRQAVPSELQEFLNSIAELQREEQQRQGQPAAAPPPLDVPMRPIPYGQTAAPVAAQPPPSQQFKRKQKGKQHPKATAPAQHREAVRADSVPQPPDATPWQPHMSSLSTTQQRTDTARQFLAATESAFKMKMPSMTPGSQHRKASPRLQKMLKGKAALRQAMLSRIVLGPPKAFS